VGGEKIGQRRDLVGDGGDFHEDGENHEAQRHEDKLGEADDAGEAEALLVRSGRNGGFHGDTIDHNASRRFPDFAFCRVKIDGERPEGNEGNEGLRWW